MRFIANKLVTGILLGVLGSAPLAAAQSGGQPAGDFSGELKLQGFLDQVRRQNGAVNASMNAGGGAEQRSREGDLIFAPTLLGSVQYLSDQKPTASPAFQGTKTTASQYSLGVSQLTEFGMAAKLSYNVSFGEVSGANPALVPGGGNYEARPTLEITQSLWRNWAGAETRANRDLIEAQALATSHVESFKIKGALAEAENAYWRLALAREAVRLAKSNLDRTVKIRDWNRRRVELHLAERSDLLQAEALLQVRQLELQGSVDEEAAAARAFNTARGVAGTEVPEKLDYPDPREVFVMSAPQRAPFREDVLAAQQQSRLAEAAARAGMEKNTPAVDLFGSASLNGRDPALGTALGNSFKTSNPTFAVGVKVTAPLAFGTLAEDRAGYRREQLAAEQAYERRVFEQEREWIDLERGLGEAKKRLELALRIEQAQEEKLAAERDRHNRGRTTTYQVLLFEQDFAQAQLGRIQSQSAVLRILARMKTFTAADQGSQKETRS